MKTQDLIALLTQVPKETQIEFVIGQKNGKPIFQVRLHRGKIKLIIHIQEQV